MRTGVACGRLGAVQATVLRAGPSVIDLATLRAHGPEGTRRLSEQEGRVLEILARRAGVVTREELESEVWGLAPSVRSEAVPVAIRRLRKKLGEGSLITVRGQGWRLGVPPAAPLRVDVPRPVTPCIGRDDEQASVGQAFGEGWRVVTLTGPGGVGKTRVAVEVARSWSGSAFVVSLRDIVAPAAVWPAMASAVGSMSSDPAEVGAALATRPDPLLVLDDAEAVQGLSEVLEALLSVADISVLVTSRRPVGHHAERVIEVRPLSEEVAVALLRDRRPRGEPLDADLARRFVRLSDYLPGVIELHAHHATLGLAEMVDSMQHGHVPDALEVSVQHSIDALDPRCRAGLLALSAFAGPVDGSVVGPHVERDVLATLRRHSLLSVADDGRLFLLATIRRVCVPMPQRPDAVRAVHEALAAIASETAQHLPERPQQAFAWFASMGPHLLAVMEEGSEEVVLDVAEGFGLAAVLSGDTSQLSEVVARLRRRSLEVPPSLDALWCRRSGREMERTLARLQRPSSRLGRLAKGMLLGGLRRFEEAIAVYDALHVEHPRSWEGLTALLRSCTGEGRGVLEAAEMRRRVDLVLQSSEREGYVLVQMRALAVSAELYGHVGDSARGLADVHRGLRMASSFDAPTAEELDLWNAMGAVHFDTDIPSSALAFEQAVAMAKRCGLTGKVMATRLNLAACWCVMDRPRDAGEIVLEVSDAYPLFAAYRRVFLAHCAIAEGRVEEGLVHLLQVDWACLASWLGLNETVYRSAIRSLVTAEVHVPNARRGVAEAAAHLEEALASAGPARVERAMFIDAFAERLERVLLEGARASSSPR